MRRQLRMILFGVVIALIAVGAIVEPPGTAAAVGDAVILAVIVALVVRERRRGS
jgi:hypothetical protein